MRTGRGPLQSRIVWPDREPKPDEQRRRMEPTEALLGREARRSVDPILRAEEQGTRLPIKGGIEPDAGEVRRPHSPIRQQQCGPSTEAEVAERRDAQ